MEKPGFPQGDNILRPDFLSRAPKISSSSAESVRHIATIIDFPSQEFRTWRETMRRGNWLKSFTLESAQATIGEFQSGMALVKRTLQPFRLQEDEPWTHVFEQVVRAAIPLSEPTGEQEYLLKAVSLALHERAEDLERHHPFSDPNRIIENDMLPLITITVTSNEEDMIVSPLKAMMSLYYNGAVSVAEGDDGNLFVHYPLALPDGKSMLGCVTEGRSEMETHDWSGRCR